MKDSTGLPPAASFGRAASGRKKRTFQQILHTASKDNQENNSAAANTVQAASTDAVQPAQMLAKAASQGTAAAQASEVDKGTRADIAPSTAADNLAQAQVKRSKGRCGVCRTCKNPRGKQGCLANKAAREATAFAPVVVDR